LPVVISNIKRINDKRIRALFSLELPSGTIINSCLLHYSFTRRCLAVKPPQIPLLTRTGAIARDARGEVRFEPAITFRSGEARHRFEATALQALRDVAPDLFEGRANDR
jgi:hypothetical protein